MRFELNKGKTLHAVDYGPHFPEQSFAVKEALGCPLECEYCFVKSHFTEDIIIYTNTDKIISEMKWVSEKYGDGIKFYLGEFSEPLIVGRYSDALSDILSFVRWKKVSIEIRTKWSDLTLLEGVEPVETAVIAWSFIPERVRVQVEKGTPSIQERIEALSKAKEIGWKVGVRLEPLVYYESWEEDYEELLKDLCDVVEGMDIGMGPLRLTSKIKERIHRLHPDSILLMEETVLCPDGKYRYPLPVRREMYLRFHKLLGKPLRIYMEEDYLLRSLPFQSIS